MSSFEPRENCIICEAVIPRSNNMHSGIRRGDKAITCCSKHARTYRRLYSYIRNSIARQQTLLKKLK